LTHDCINILITRSEKERRKMNTNDGTSHSILDTFSRLAVAAILLTALLLGLQPVPVAHAAIITVNSTADNLTAGDGNCTLREAIINANLPAGGDSSGGDCIAGAAGADTITLPVGTYTLSIATTYEDAAVNGDLDITADLTINGTGAPLTIVDANLIDRVFHIPNTGVNVEIYDVTIQNGYRDINACTLDGGVSGGGIHSSGGVHLERCVIRDNETNNTGFGSGSGGGIRVAEGTMTLVDCAVLDNTTQDAGGGIKNGTFDGTSTTLTLINTTVSGNSSDDFTGGVHTGCDATTTFEHSTIVNNTSNATALSSHAGGINGNGTVNIMNTIVANNTDGNGRNDCAGTLISRGYNLIEDASTCTINGDTTGNITGSDPSLGPLADNGGPTETHALLTGSPAIDQIPSGTNGCGSTYTSDQRGAARPYNTTCDIGAFEYRSPTQNCSLSTGTDITIENVTFNFSALGSLTCVTVDEMGADHLLAPGPASDLNWWHIAGNGTGFTVNLTFLDNATTPKVCKWPGSLGGYGWDCTGIQVDNVGSVTRQGVTSFSDWAVGDNVSPTAITLRGLAAHTGTNIPVVLSLGLLGMIIVGLALALRRRSGQA